MEYIFDSYTSRRLPLAAHADDNTEDDHPDHKQHDEAETYQ